MTHRHPHSYRVVTPLSSDRMTRIDSRLIHLSVRLFVAIYCVALVHGFLGVVTCLFLSHRLFRSSPLRTFLLMSCPPLSFRSMSLHLVRFSQCAFSSGVSRMYIDTLQNIHPYSFIFASIVDSDSPLQTFFLFSHWQNLFYLTNCTRIPLSSESFRLTDMFQDNSRNCERFAW